MKKHEEREKGRGKTSSYVFGAVAAVFLVIGYQAAMFLHRASVLRLAGKMEHPDTVYVINGKLADSLLRTMLPDKKYGMSSDEMYGMLPDGITENRPQGAPVFIRKESARSGIAGSVMNKLDGAASGKGGRKTENFKFNPNTVSVEDLCRLGFTPKQAAAIDNYRKKGGRFRRKTDFAKSFVVSDSVYARLEDYIDIPALDLNTADSAALDGLPGIGGYFASEIIKYRSRLHGYSYKEQLMEIHRFDRARYDALSDLVEVNPATAVPYGLWALPADSLRLHPYIGSYAADGIVLYREYNPKEEWTVENLLRAEIITAEAAEKLSRCIIGEP